MTFTAPLALVLLLLLIPVIALGLPRTRFRRVRDTASLILRCLLLTLVVLALAGASIVRSADRLAVVFVVDVSDSISQSAREAQVAYMRAALEQMAPDDEAAVVVFGANALVERTMNSVRELPGLRSAPVTSNSDLAEAIRIGLGLFPSDAAQRMVILSDGTQTVGDALAAARRAAATGVEISYVPFSRDPAPEVQVLDVRVPEEIGAGQQFDLGFTIRAEAETPATVTVLAGGAILQRAPVTLLPGDNNYAISLTATDTGFRDFEVRVDPDQGDAFYQNNQLAAFSQVVGPPRVLLVSTSDDEAQPINDALTTLGLNVDSIRPTTLPIGLAALAAYDSIILNNVPATVLTNRRMETLATYVRDLGGGLVVVGGPDAYAPGGYFQTPLEDVLPVEMQIRDQQRLPQLTLAYVIDRSGSMGAAGPSGVANIELAKEAMIRSIEFLQPTDRAGVVSFDTEASWIADIQPVSDRLALQTFIGTLQASGGTDIEAGYNLAAEGMLSNPSARQHIILLTDGGANQGDLVETARELFTGSDITTSVISIGGGVEFLGQMAREGGGNYHEVLTVEQIPSIFAAETVLASRAYIVEEGAFVPQISAVSAILDGIDSAPSLLGYVATTPKQTAQVILRVPNEFNDPLLAAWQYGLGRAVAFTSDATGRWAANWIPWEGFARFWSQTVRWTITESAENNVETRIVMEGESARVVVDARDASGGFLNGLQLQTSIIDPELGVQQIQLQQVAPGRYEAEFSPGQEGAYFLRLTAANSEQPINETTGWVMSYSPEYDTRPVEEGQTLLTDVATLTSGSNLIDDVGAVFTRNLPSRPTFNAIAPWLLLAAALLLPIDIAIRRLMITRSDLARARAALLPRRESVTTTERMSSLMEAKQRAQQTIKEETPSQPTPTPASTAAALRANRAARKDSSPQDAKPIPPPENIAGKLLEKRRGRDDS